MDEQFWRDWESGTVSHLMIQGATSAGKTLVSELAILDTCARDLKAVVLVLLKAMVHERREQFRQDMPNQRDWGSSSDHKVESSSGCYDPSRLRCSPSTGTHFLFVQLAMGFEGDVEISSALLLKGALPLLSFPPGGKAACAFLLSLPLPVLKANHGISAAILFVLTDGHLLRRPRPM